VGAILTMDSGFGAKLLYGQAYRNGTGQERGSQVPGFNYGNSALKPESIDTVDAQISYGRPIYSVALTYFHSDQNDVISRSFPDEGFQTVVNGSLSPPGVSVTINRGEVHSQGF